MRILVDAHCDTITRLHSSGEGLWENSLHLDLQRLTAMGPGVQFFAIWLRAEEHLHAMLHTLAHIDTYYSELKKNATAVSHVASFADIQKNLAEGKFSALLAIEGGESLMGRISSLRMLYRLGVRALTLTWNARNALGDGVNGNGGLTEFGHEVVHEMNRLGMLVDVSHLSEAGFWDVEKIAAKPYVATHSNARALCNHKRNLTDEQILAIAQRGGVIGINIYPPFLVESGEATLADALKHIEYIRKLAGEDCIGIGCDFDGISETPLDFTEVSGMAGLREALDARYGTVVSDKIMGGNFLRVLEAVL